MSNRSLRYVVLIATLAISGLVIVQIHWIRQAFNQQEAEFHRDVNVALNSVTGEVLKLNNSVSPVANPIKQISGNYYVVQVNSAIDANILQHLLIRSFAERGLNIDFEYGIYDCTTECMVYGEYVTADPSKVVDSPTELPVWDGGAYYFGVYFPSRSSHLVNRMGIWIFSTLVLLVVVIFFAFALFVILKQRRLSEIQKDFINNMTHEFKTPLATLEIAAKVLKGKSIMDQPNRLLKYATIIESESLRLREHIDRILHSANSSKSEMELRKDQIDVHALIRSVVDQLNSSLESAPVHLELKAITHRIQADVLHLTNALHNILENAIKYTPSDPDIRVETTNNKGNIVIQVLDNGSGIPSDRLKAVFDKFYRVSSGDVHNVKGFGIGLYYVKLVVEAHGGSVGVRSKLGQGSKFSISLPFE